MFSFHFMVNAFRAATIVAVTAGAIGWFMVLRGQAFAGHTLALAGFPGAAGATWLGVSATLGYFSFCTAAAVVIAVLPGRTGNGHSEESAGIGVVQALTLAFGFLFVALYRGLLSGVNALLFGSFLGISDGQVAVLLAVGVAALVLLGAIGRPLLFASVDPDVARARGVPVSLLSLTFLLLLGVTVAEVSQITGTLLVFALLVMPAASAQALTVKPVTSLLLTIAIATAVAWAALAAAFYSPYPIGFWITSFGFGVYLLSTGTRYGLSRRRPAGAET
jgi:zinc/manganese transport system permease protein